MMSSIATTWTSVAEKIRAVENDMNRIKEKMREIEIKYPRIYFGECSNKLALKNYSNLDDQLSILLTRICKLEDDLRGK